MPFLSGCENLIIPEASSPAVSPTHGEKSGTAVGSWGGTIHYTAINGNPFDIEMRVLINQSEDRVTTVAGASGAETVAASHDGTTVNWLMLGPDTVTEVALCPLSNGEHMSYRV